MVIKTSYDIFSQGAKCLEKEQSKIEGLQKEKTVQKGKVEG